MIGWQDVFGVYEKALALRETKLSLVSSNLTNADTPGYQARDIDFRAVMNSELASVDTPLPLTRSASAHFSGMEGNSPYPIQYRVPLSPSADGNTVNPHYEKTAFMSDAIRYQSTLAFIRSRSAMLMKVIRGE